MKDWWIWSSADLVEWTKEAVVSPEQSLKWDKQTNECWATDAAFVNGKYYFYVSAGGGEVGVMSAPSLKGPWTDPLGKPLLSTAFGKSQNPPTTFRDPCVFQDPDTKESYIVAGVFTYYITKLNSDMISLAETPKLVNFSTHTYGPCGDGKTDDKPFLHKNGDTYYLSWGCFCESHHNVSSTRSATELRVATLDRCHEQERLRPVRNARSCHRHCQNCACLPVRWPAGAVWQVSDRS
jgi:arabinoxylan arabinofuranohydrolase